MRETIRKPSSATAKEKTITQSLSSSATQWSLTKTSALIKVKTVSQSALSLTSLAGILMNSNLYLKSTIFMQKVVELFIILRVGIFGTVASVDFLIVAHRM